MSKRSKLWSLPLALMAACDEGGTTDPDGGTPDGGNNEQCGQMTPISSTGGMAKMEATLPAADGNQWLVVSYATSELRTNETTDFAYTKAAAGGLLGRGPASSNEALSPELRETFARLEKRVQAEAAVRRIEKQGRLSKPVLGGTRVRSYTDPKLGIQQGANACTADDPGVCKGANGVCVIPENTTQGVCSSSLSLKFALNPNDVKPVTAAVRVVTDHVAIVVDEADAASVTDANLEELAKRFDEQIRPLDHALFGEPVANGKDFDGNGVTTILVTSKLGATLGNEIVGIFFSDDLRPSAEVAHSNVADILYVSPPGTNVSLDQLSGTIAHEYEHLVNFYAKAVKGSSDREAAWLDEGLAVFAEDVTGYGADAFATHYAYLQDPGSYSLTGNGVLASGDSIQRRGMASLFVRYLFEQKGGATFGAAPGTMTDGGGVAAVRGIVQGTDTELEAIGKVTGRTVHEWIGDFFLAVGLDGRPAYDCVAKHSFKAPETATYTGIQRGVNLHGTFQTGSTIIEFNGPVTNTLEAETVPLAWNAGEYRTIDGSGLNISVSVPAADFDGDLERVGLWATPLAK